MKKNKNTQGLEFAFTIYQLNNPLALASLPEKLESAQILGGAAAPPAPLARTPMIRTHIFLFTHI